MIEMTIEEAIERGRNDQIDSFMGHNLYVIRNGKDVFYVGQTRKTATGRLLEHLGMGARGKPASSIGEMILQNMPESLQWSFCLYTYQECDDLVCKHVLETTYAGSFLTKEWYLTRVAEEMRIDFSEEALIAEHKPHLNRMMAVPTGDIPEKYTRPLDSSARFLPKF